MIQMDGTYLMDDSFSNCDTSPNCIQETLGVLLERFVHNMG